MPRPEDVYVRCDDLETIPGLMKRNYLFETKILKKLLPKNAIVLQVGSMDGERAIRLLKVRPDLQMSGLEIEEPLIKIAKKKLPAAGFKMNSILGDITHPPELGMFDYVICLNNTLGYIDNQQAALAGMRKLGKNAFVSVYGEGFTNSLAKDYFTSIGLSINKIDGNKFIMQDFTTVRRYSRSEVEKWSKRIIDTPAGYFCIVK